MIPYRYKTLLPAAWRVTLSLCLTGITELTAQQAPFARPTPPPPPSFTPPPMDVANEGVVSFAPGLKPSDPIQNLVLVDNSLDQVFRLLEELTGKMVLTQENLPSPRINFNSRGDLNRQEAVLALETILSLNGISISSMGDKFLKATPVTSIRYQAPDLLMGSTLTEQPSQRYYAKIFKINHLGLDDVAQIVNTVMTPGLASQLVMRKSNSILVTDTLSNLQQIERVLMRADVPLNLEEKMIFRSLNHVSAQTMKERLLSMAQGPLKRYLEGNTFFDSDERTNQIVIVTHQKNVDIIESVIASLDNDAAPLTRTEVFYIKHAEATNVAKLIDALISRQNNRKDDASNPSGGRNRPQVPGPDGQPIPVPPSLQDMENAMVAGGGVDSQNLQFSSFATIEPDERSNAIIAYGTPSDIRYISSLIDRIDILLAQVKIDVVIVEVNVGNSNKRGIDHFGINLDSAKEITVGLNQLVGLDGVFSTPADLPIRIGATLEDFTLNTVFQTAQSDSDVSILSSPTLVTTHNRKATIKAGEKRPLISASSTDMTGSSIRSTLDYRDIGIELTVTPLIGSNGIVQMEIEQSVDSVISTTKIDGNDQPIIGSRSATSFVSVQDGQVIVLGGLQEKEISTSHGRMFLLGQIPILGDWLFSSKREEVKIKDLVIFIRPQVITNAEEANAQAGRSIQIHPQREEIEHFLSEGKFIDSKARKDP